MPCHYGLVWLCLTLLTITGPGLWPCLADWFLSFPSDPPQPPPTHLEVWTLSWQLLPSLYLPCSPHSGLGHGLAGTLPFQPYYNTWIPAPYSFVASRQENLMGEIRKDFHSLLLLVRGESPISHPSYLLQGLLRFSPCSLKQTAASLHFPSLWEATVLLDTSAPQQHRRWQDIRQQ